MNVPASRFGHSLTATGVACEIGTFFFLLGREHSWAAKLQREKQDSFEGFSISSNF